MPQSSEPNLPNTSRSTRPLLNAFFSPVGRIMPGKTSPLPRFAERTFDLMKMAPTSANCSPARLVFVTSAEGKAKLLPHLMEDNRKKTETAPVCVILAYDVRFYELLPQLFPHNLDAVNWFSGSADFAEQTAFRNSSLQGGYLMLAARALGSMSEPCRGSIRQALMRRFSPTGGLKPIFCAISAMAIRRVFSRARRVWRLTMHARLSDSDARMMPETVLACDTTQGACSAALWHKGAVVAERFIKMQRGHAEALLPALAEIKHEVPIYGRTLMCWP